MEVRTVAVVEPPPPPPEVLEEPPPPEPEPEPEPEMQPDTSQNLSLSDLQLMLNPGGGGGAGGQLLSEALSDAMKGASEAFSGMSIEQKPRPVYQPPPKYPREVFKAGVSGVVTVEGVVGVDGKVRNLRAVGSYPHPALRDAAIAAVSKWRFEPGVRDGTKAPFKIQIPLKFALG
ncbi:MAG: TonB family protein [Verrucomicrobiota bacterium]